MSYPITVIPAQAGIQLLTGAGEGSWTPAFAGVTELVEGMGVAL